MKILGITIPTNGKYEDLIKLNYDEKKVKKNIIQSWSKMFKPP
jgi:chaperonin GroEL (HSP60 family)